MDRAVVTTALDLEVSGLPRPALVEDAVWVQVLEGERWRLWAVPIPDGDVEQSSSRLGALLAECEPSTLAGACEVFA